jgi:hypothetical protein
MKWLIIVSLSLNLVLGFLLFRVNADLDRLWEIVDYQGKTVIKLQSQTTSLSKFADDSRQKLYQMQKDLTATYDMANTSYNYLTR